MLSRIGIVHHRTENGGSHWQWNKDFKNLKIGFNLYRHVHPATPDRWTFDPSFTYNCQNRPVKRDTVMSRSAKCDLCGLVVTKHISFEDYDESIQPLRKARFDPTEEYWTGLYCPTIPAA